MYLTIMFNKLLVSYYDTLLPTAMSIVWTMFVDIQSGLYFIRAFYQ